MPKYRDTFDLNVSDVSMIEDALTKRAGEISQTIMEKSSHNPFERQCESVKGYVQELTEIRELLGRLHDQKIWYRPANYAPVG